MPELTPTPRADSEDNVPLLSLRGVSKSFGAVTALDRVDLDVYAGQVLALVGDNGAGKSTLIKAMSGAQPPDEGSFEFEGQPVKLGSVHDANRLGLRFVYQDLAICDNLSIAANLFLGQELFRKWRLRALESVAMQAETERLLQSIGVTTIRDYRAEAGMLSGGQRQAIAIARSLLGHPKIVVLDEPTAALGVTQTAQVLRMVHELRDQGLGVVLVSHNLGEVFSVADKIAVLRLGANAGTWDANPRNQNAVVAAITGANDPAEVTQ